MYDVLILGGGPAGYTAALYAARSGLTTAVIEKLTIGGQMVLTDRIDNYPAYPDGIDGYTLGQEMKKGAELAGTKTIFSEILAVRLGGETKTVTTDSGIYHARSVIIATGADHKHLGLTEEEALIGRGVHYCATCDGMFYRNKTVVVIGGGNTAVGAAKYLSRMCKEVILVHRRESLRAGKTEQDQLRQLSNVRLVLGVQVKEFLHETRVNGVRIVQNETPQDIACDGVFVCVGQKPNTELFSELTLDASGYIVADESTKTNLPGVFAAGDVRTKSLRQVITACADGAVAASQAEVYLSK